MCAAAFSFVLASSAPVVYPSYPTMTGSTTVYGRGPVATMQFQPSTNGVWWISVTDSGLKSVDVRVYDVSGNLSDKILAKIMRFDGDRNTTGNSTLMQVVGGHSYVLEATGKQSGSALLTGWFKSSVNLRPVALISAPQDALVAELVQFSGNASYDTDGAIVSWSWVFGDGSTANGAVVTHAYATEGDYLVLLIVNDDGGANSSTSVVITIVTSGPIEGGHWSQPVQIGVQSNQSYTGLRAAMNSKGQAVVAWCSYQAPSWHVWATRFAAESGWQQPESVGTCDNLGQPAVGIDDAGNVTVAWIEDNVVFTRRNVIAYGAWDDPVMVSSGTGHPYTLTLAVNPNGRAVLAWLEQVEAHYGIFASVRAIGNSWSAPVLIEDSTAQADSPCAAIAPDGKAIVAFSIYVVQPSPQWDVWANLYDPGQGWRGATLVEGLPQFSFAPIVSMDSSGNAFAVWDYMTKTAYPDAHTVYANRFVNGTWQQEVRLDPETAPSETYPRVCAYGTGNAVVVWLAQDNILGRPGEVRACRYTSGVGWSTPEDMTTGAQMYYQRLAVDASGNAFVGFLKYNSSGSEVVAAVHSPGGGWSEPDSLKRVSSAWDLVVAAGPTNTAIVAWTEFETGVGSLWACNYNSSAAQPIAEAGPIQYVPVPIPDMITLDGSASYASCDIVSYVWTWVGGVDNTPKMVTGMNPSVPWQWFYYIENYTVTLTITDVEGNTATDTTNVYIAFRLNREDNAFGDQQWYANSDGYLKVMIDNHGMNWVNWTVMDCTTSPHIVYESTMYFSGDGVYVSEPFWMSAGQHVQVEYELDGGPPGAYMFVYGFFVPVP
jgi:PKD repeat protein